MTYFNTKLMPVILAIALLVASDYAWSVDGDPPTAESVRQHLDQLSTIALDGRTAEGQVSSSQIMEWLRSAPSELVIPQVVDALEGNPGFNISAVRRSAYGLLRDHRAASTQEGFRQLLKGVHERDGLHASLMALGLTPEWGYADLVKNLIPLLHGDELPEYHLQRVMELFAKTREHAAPALPAIVDIYRNESRSEEVRMIAGRTMALVGGTRWAIQKFGIKDILQAPSPDAKLIVGALAGTAMETKGTFELDPSLRDTPRRILLEGMKHNDRDVRQWAVWGVLKAYTDDEAVRARAPGEYEIHPQLVRAFEDMMQNDPDPELRDGAAQIVNEWWPRAIEERIARDEMEREKKSEEE